MDEAMANNISEFEKNGFVRSHHNTINKLRSSSLYRKYFRIFKSAMIDTNRRNPKYSARDIFGDKLVYYYDKRREKEFINFLVERFYEKNPQPDQYMRRTFTRILHHHNLCWHGCCHAGKKCVV